MSSEIQLGKKRVLTHDKGCEFERVVSCGSLG